MRRYCSGHQMKDHRHPKARDKFDNILLPITICCMHASMPPKWTSRRLRGYLPQSQERVEVGSTDEEALPPPGSARVDCDFWHCHTYIPLHSSYCNCMKHFPTMQRDVVHSVLQTSNVAKMHLQIYFLLLTFELKLAEALSAVFAQNHCNLYKYNLRQRQCLYCSKS